MAGTIAPAAFTVALSLVSGCNDISTNDSPEPDFYLSHSGGANPIWLRTGNTNPAALTVSGLPSGAAINDLAAVRFNDLSEFLYLVSSSANSLLVVSRSGSSYQVVTSVPVGAGAFALALDANASYAYVSNTTDNSVTVVDLTTYTAVATIALPAGSQPRGIAVTPTGTKAYVALSGAGSVSVIDAVARTVTGSIAVGSQPNRMVLSPDGQQLYVANTGSDSVSVIDVLSDSVSATIAGTTGTRAVGANSTGTDLFAGQGSAVGMYDTATLSSLESPAATASNPAYVLGIGPGSFLSVDQAAARVTERWKTLSNPVVNRVFTVADSPTAVAIARDVNRAPANSPQCHLTVTTVGSGTVAANPTSSNGNYTCGTTVTLTATPATGNQFTQWSGDLTGTTNPGTILLSADRNVTATFAVLPAVQTTVQANSPAVAGLQVTADGHVASGPYTYNSAVGSTHTHSTTSPQVVAGTHWTFQNWTPSLTPNVATSLTQNVTTPAANTTFLANFTKTGYVVSKFGCPVVLQSGATPLSTDPLVYPPNASITVSTFPVEVFHNGAWLTYNTFSAQTVDGPISIWGLCSTIRLTACTAAPSGLAGWWGFDGGSSAGSPSSTSVADLSGSSNDGTVLGGATQSGGKVGGSLASGTAYVEVPSSASLNFGSGSFSGDMWLRWSDLTKNQGDRTLLSKYAPGHGWELSLTRASESPGLNTLRLRLNGSAAWDSQIPVLPADGNWHLVAFSYDATQPYSDRVKFYIDLTAISGVPVVNQDQTQFDVSNSSPLRIGQAATVTPGAGFEGDLDEVELFNRVLAPTDLQPIFAADVLGKCKPGAVSPATVTAGYSNTSVGGNIVVTFQNTGSATATNLRVNSVASSNPNLILQTGGAAGPVLTFPVSLGNLAGGQSTNRSFMFASNSPGTSVNVAFSLTVKYQADNMMEQTAVISVPSPR